ncbi:hypothetical protein GCM10009623_32490 [Nocardioides aestuarii]|uniref:DUF952 domain-containing protein n=1 Tax=Nocardioides aestuarii TaxID=252231 RepID=A0ABW4TPB2_9ACTN
MARIFHLATEADWELARRSGAYTTSTRGVTLAEEGFIHASRADQWQGVRDRFYSDVTEPLVLLVIETDRLDVPVVEEQVGEETYPHVYGAIRPAAVVQALPLEKAVADSGRSFSSLFLAEVFRNVLLGLLLMGLLAGGVVAGSTVDTAAGPWLGLLAGAAVWTVVLLGLRRARG